ncbi:LysR family transcriptional regulator [Marinobacter daepoensis]|uniref:LysR family transcriptional regulator n=1 Tax=Marinobacter daepoensis TaxID=262077 RepID=A0ABS3BFW2_9GAMM|nr:LysR family transcriptional regulator [Marinobacter daepoensis]MBN7770724.1 LysR family transcriptional regulator [Marinobacter daepoensis]MBY6034080.1 LysR family transcriptional regulator [Marinobacter daepoensis]MBY6078585.1 LysR family transcriptional regulator [Marinobacter daepoensis]
MYDPQDLEAFVSVVRTGSLTACTTELGLPKSTLSRRIRQLEEAVGQPLLLRQSRKIVPNDAGRVFYRYCNEILELMARGREALDELREEVSGHLVLYCHEAFVRGWFSGLVESFMAAHSDVQVVIRTQRQTPSELSDAICLWLGELGDTRLRREGLGQLSQGVYGSPGYFSQRQAPETPGELSEHPWVDLLGSTEGGMALHNVRHGSYPVAIPARRLTVDQFCVQSDAIAAGRGLGLLPHWLVALRSRAHPGSFQGCLAEWSGPSLPVTLLYPHGHLPRRVRAFIAHVRSSIPEQWSCPGADEKKGGLKAPGDSG